MLIRRLAAALVFAASAAIALLAGCDRDPVLDATQAYEQEDAPEFAPGQLEHHFQKHGAEMGFATKEDYLRAAQDLVRGGPGVETLQRGGDTLFYRSATNEFAVLSRENVIRTYFRPHDGRRYWERQMNR